ncbi:hypothetical protein ACFVX3_31845 [Rhodococcus erythropolis]|uniref:hypothetical protein n=1 Tax=Rhodococcus erythropolis TaxID=1833 RepID=UPI00294A58C7|nr:hypothetical protein [Rhodococcus erythropolis]MDV6275302.1 hypothetical protein [Rhodococcus erythropolis]MDV6278575.1 hypothetical protein [Rhodococcus erythropolis]
MSEAVIRVRKNPGGLDENDDPVASTVSKFPLKAKAVTPGATAKNASLVRNGETIEHTVYFMPAPDLTNDDQLIVRGLTYDIRILDWRSAFGTGRRGLEVLAVTGRG